MSIEYKCAICGGEFTADWEDDEAIEEMGENFPGYKKEDCDVVCEDCYNKIVRTITGG